LKNYLITGGAGFIGSHLTNILISQGNNVTVIDNFITGSNSNLSKLINNQNFKLYDEDICKFSKFNIKFDHIIHLASPASPSDYLRYPIETLKTGSLGTLNALEIAKKNNANFLLASTSEVYGDPLVHPQNEKYFGNVNPVGPRSVYDEAKRFSESLTVAFGNKNFLNYKIARIFNTYGPKMKVNDGRAIPNFINQALKNHDISVYGDGSQTRSFCYIDDTVDGLLKLLHSNYNRPMNIGNPNEFSIKKLAQLIKQIIDSDSKIVYKEIPIDDPKLRKPDISLANKILGWEPIIDLNEGLLKTINYFRKL